MFLINFYVYICLNKICKIIFVTILLTVESIIDSSSDEEVTVRFQSEQPVGKSNIKE